MKINFGAKPYCYPQPVFIIAAYDENGTPNAMNAAWGGISDEKEVFACISPSHKTTKNILIHKAFTVSIGTADYVTQCDYVGVVSGNEEPDKMLKSSFHTVKSEFVDAPLIDELPMALECRLKSYDAKTGHLFGEIVNVIADERVLTDGNIDADKLQAICFDPSGNSYRVLGKKVGNAFEDGLKLK